MQDWMMPVVALAGAALVPAGLGWLLSGRMPRTHPGIIAVMIAVVLGLLVVAVAGVLILQALIRVGAGEGSPIDHDGALVAQLFTWAVLQIMLLLAIGFPAALFAGLRRRKRAD